MVEIRAERWLGAVLAGGRSTRFGADKAELAVGGDALVERVRDVVAGVVGAAVIVGGARGEIPEPAPGEGPLQALIAALREAARRGREGAIVVACDLPCLDAATVRRLAAPLREDVMARVPRVDGRLQVLAAAWSVAALDALEAAFAAGERSVQRATARLALEIADGLDARALCDVDTPEALRQLVGDATRAVPIERWPGATQGLRPEPRPAAEVEDRVAVEEPLEIVVDQAPLAVLLRTPTGADDDLALAAGFLLSEGVIERLDDLDALAPCLDPAAAHRDNRVLVTLAPGVSVPDAARRSFATGSSCGLCGKTTIASLARRLPTREARAALSARAVGAMGEVVRAVQAGFASTGALHAAGVFEGARLAAIAEDVGRHNAVDKVVGRALRARELPLAGKVLWVSGRSSFELVQKALVAGADGLVAVGAPTSLAVELARAGGLTLVGFAREGRFNVYAGTVEA